MDEQEYIRIMAITVDKTCEKLDDTELNAIYMVALMGANPTQVKGYDKVERLFTESGGTKMHSMTLDALAVVWERRCGKNV
jgi:hypothetical protein